MSSGPVTSSCVAQAVAHRSHPSRRRRCRRRRTWRSRSARARPGYRRCGSTRPRADRTRRRVAPARRAPRSARRSRSSRRASRCPRPRSPTAGPTPRPSSASSWSSIVAAASRTGMTTLSSGFTVAARPTSRPARSTDRGSCATRSASARSKRATMTSGSTSSRCAWARAASHASRYRSGSSMSSPRATAHSPIEASPRTNRPPGPTVSRSAGRSRASTGIPLAWASSTTRGRPSSRNGASSTPRVGVDRAGVVGGRAQQHVGQLGGEPVVRARRAPHPPASTTPRTRRARPVAPRPARARSRGRSSAPG